MASTSVVFQDSDKSSFSQDSRGQIRVREGRAFYSQAPLDCPNLDGRAPKTQTISHTLMVDTKEGMHTSAAHSCSMCRYPHSVDLSLWRCCSGLICHANCCLGVHLQGESPALEELSFASWSLQESTSFPLPREKVVKQPARLLT